METEPTEFQKLTCEFINEVQDVFPKYKHCPQALASGLAVIVANLVMSQKNPVESMDLFIRMTADYVKQIGIKSLEVDGDMDG